MAYLMVKWRRNHRYVCGHVGLMAMLLRYIEPKVSGWVHVKEVLAHSMVQYPQSAYTRLTMLLQAEWQHLSCTVPGVKGRIQPIKNMIWGKFIPALMGLTEAEVYGNMPALFANSVKQGSLNLHDSVAEALPLAAPPPAAPPVVATLPAELPPLTGAPRDPP